MTDGAGRPGRLVAVAALGAALLVAATAAAIFLATRAHTQPAADPVPPAYSAKAVPMPASVQQTVDAVSSTDPERQSAALAQATRAGLAAQGTTQLLPRGTTLTVQPDTWRQDGTTGSATLTATRSGKTHDYIGIFFLENGTWLLAETEDA